MHNTHVGTSSLPAGVHTLTVHELFDFAVDPVLQDEGIDEALDQLMAMATRCVPVMGGQRLCVGSTQAPDITGREELNKGIDGHSHN